ncbi:MAG: Holliday junction resolvase RuvX [Candidatus Peregrinibacteria bacterium]|nr:Holliday junction resolvase RuvX [Candidatus Peregrinibacteria bacterium]
MVDSGKILALDYGLRRIGLAITDKQRTMVFPRPILEHKGESYVFEQIQKIVSEEGVTAIVLGYPFDDRHVETTQTEKMRAFGEKLSAAVSVPVFFEDEKYTTAQAEALLDSYGYDYKEKKTQRDSIAAMLILQSYLDRV